jgi:ubiquinone/menaquinone biosynthesis C-methylase UbiE
MAESLVAVARAYDAWHAAWAEPLAADDPWHAWVLAALDPARDLAGRRVLEAGCGRGGCAVAVAAARPATLVATDLSAVALGVGARAARERGAAVTGWPAADLARLPFADGAFDTVVCCETIEHVLDPAGAVGELARVLAPGGRLVLTAPSYLNATGLYRGWLRLVGRRYDEGGQPVATFTTLPRTLRWVRDAGLVEERVDGSGHYLPWPGRAPVRVDALDAAWARPVLRWLALHTGVVARRPARDA